MINARSCTWCVVYRVALYSFSCSFLDALQGCHRLAGGQGESLNAREKSGNFISVQSGKIGILMKRQGKLKQLNMADLMLLKAGRNIWGHCDLNDIFP